MTTLAMTPEDRLAQLGIELPEVPVPIANFQPFRRHGDLVYLAGQTCEWNGTMVYAGKVGRDQLEDYAARKGVSEETAEKYLRPVLAD